MTKVKENQLVYGIAFTNGGKKIVPAGKALEPFTLELLEPVDDITALTISAPTLGDTISVTETAMNDHQPGTPQFNEAVFRAYLAKQCDPVPNPEQMDKFAGVDHDRLNDIINKGLDPVTHERAFKRRAGTEYTRTAYTRLHLMSDRKAAEQRLTTSAAENPAMHEAYLTWLVTRFTATEKVFGSKPIEFTEFMNIAWADYLVLTRAILSRDYKPLTEVLEGRVEVDGKSVPFQDGAQSDVEEAAAQS